MTRPFLEGTGVARSFGGLQVLTRVDFAVSEGEIVALIGPNGAGKTTLFNLVGGLLRPSAGSIRLGDHDITAMPAYRIARLGLGRTFQTPRPFLDLTAAENVAAAARWSERPDGTPAELLARVILLDELLAGLTPTESARVTAILRRIRDERGVGLFWVEHVMKAIMET